MLQISKWKVTLVVLALLFGVVFTFPNLLSKSALDKLPGWVPQQTLNLGLDLQGGSYILLEADIASLQKERLTNTVEDIRNELSDGVAIPISTLGQVGDTIVVTLATPSDAALADKRISKLIQPGPDGIRDLNLVRRDEQITLSYLPNAGPALAAKAMDQSIEIVRKRVDGMGTKEAPILRQGPNRILVQAPGESDPEKLKAIIGRTAKLTFQMVDDSIPVEVAQTGIVPPGSEILPVDPRPGQPAGYELVRKRAIVTGEMLTSAVLGFDQNNGPAVDFRFNSIGGRKFGEVTRDNIGKRFAIVLDGKVISAPTIQSAIVGGSGQITNMGSQEAASDLVLLLKNGALPVKLVTIQQGQVGAELGADAVRAGVISTVVGFVAIVVFMVMSYGFVFGGVSVIALIVNVLLIFGFMSLSQSTLTLPGVAGLILTLAVAVDANVLIYERIRDEERAGHPPLMALETGFRRASVSILDANITSLISAVIMMAQGSGPVKGFATMLAVGVFTSVFTAMIVSQVLLGLWFRSVRPKKLPI